MVSKDHYELAKLAWLALVGKEFAGPDATAQMAWSHAEAFLDQYNKVSSEWDDRRLKLEELCGKCDKLKDYRKGNKELCGGKIKVRDDLMSAYCTNANCYEEFKIPKADEG